VWSIVRWKDVHRRYTSCNKIENGIQKIVVDELLDTEKVEILRTVKR